MASVYRRKYKDRDGQSTLCEKHTVECKVGGAFRRLPGFKDKKASEELGRKVERLANLREAGEQPDAALSKWLEGLDISLRDRLAGLGLLTGRAAAATRPLAQHLADYRQALLDGVASSRQKGPATAKHAALIEFRVKAMLDGIGATFLSEVTPERVGRYLADRRSEGMSVQTSNNYVKDCKAFLNWMVRAKRAPENPITCMSKQQVTPKHRKHVRRVLEVEEAEALLGATKCGDVCYGMTGEERYWLYRLALETGLRSSELRMITKESFGFDADPSFVWLSGDATKNREAAEIPLRSGTAAELHAFVRTKTDKAPVFPMPAVDAVVRMLRHDLKVAGIAYETDSGVADFHSLRSTCLSWLAAANVDVKTLQTYARHSTPTLTMNVYTHTLRGSLADAASRLPDFSPPPSREALRATGTEDIRPHGDLTGGHTGGKTGGKGARGGSRPVVSKHGTEVAGRNVRAQQTPISKGENTRMGMHAEEREWMGIEPTRRRASDASTALKAAGPTRRPDTPMCGPHRRAVGGLYHTRAKWDIRKMGHVP